MKRTRFYSVVVLLIYCFGMLFEIESEAQMVSITAFSDEQLQKICHSLKLTDITESVSNPTGSVCSFDVSENGRSLLALTDGEILILDSQGSFEKRFHFTAEGSYGVKWGENAILLFLFRGNCVLEIAEDGLVVQAYYIDAQENIWTTLQYKRSQSVGGCEYYVKNNMGVLNFLGGQTYSQFVRVEENGNSIVLYDVNGYKLARTIALLAFFLLLIALIVIVFIRRIGKFKNGI